MHFTQIEKQRQIEREREERAESGQGEICDRDS